MNSGSKETYIIFKTIFILFVFFVMYFFIFPMISVICLEYSATGCTFFKVSVTYIQNFEAEISQHLSIESET